MRKAAIKVRTAPRIWSVLLAALGFSSIVLLSVFYSHAQGTPRRRIVGYHRRRPALIISAGQDAAALMPVRDAAAPDPTRHPARKPEPHTDRTDTVDLALEPASLQVGELAQECAPTPDVQRSAFLRRLPLDRGCHSALCVATQLLLKQVPGASAIVLTVATPEQNGLLATFARSTAALRVPALALVATTPGHDVTADLASARAAVDRRMVIAALPGEGGVAPLLGRKWAAIEVILRSGVGVLYADVDAVFAAPPFALLHNDSDVEVLSEAIDDAGARGFIFGSDDPSMGWGRYAESMRLDFVSPAMVHLMPTAEAAAVCARMASSGASQGWAVLPGCSHEAAEVLDGEAMSLTFELVAPAHDGVSRMPSRPSPIRRATHVTLAPHHTVRVRGPRLLQALAPRSACCTVSAGSTRALPTPFFPTVRGARLSGPPPCLSAAVGVPRPRDRPQHRPRRRPRSSVPARRRLTTTAAMSWGGAGSLGCGRRGVTN